MNHHGDPSAAAVLAERTALRSLTTEIWLQPIYDLRSGEVAGAEALSRFFRADGTPEPTESVLARAHAVGMGRAFELRAFELALARVGEVPPPAYVSINASARVLESGALAPMISRSTADPARVIVEITEGSPVTDPPAARAATLALRRQGCRLALDDLGAGHAGQIAAHIGSEVVKLDRPLVDGLGEPGSHAQRAQVRRIVRRCSPGTRIVAEGLDNLARDAPVLIDLGVGYGQGFGLQRPARMPSFEPIGQLAQLGRRAGEMAL